MPQRKFVIEVVHNVETDAQAKEAFGIVAHVCRKAARDIKAKLMVLGGSTLPQIMLTSDDMIEGLQEMLIKLDEAETEQKPDAQEERL